MQRGQMTIDGWMDKEDVYSYNGILHSNQKEWNVAIFNNVEWTGLYYDKENMSEKDTHHIKFHRWENS